MGALLAARPTNQRATIRQIAITLLLLLRLAHERIHQKSQRRKDSVEIQKGPSHFAIMHGWIEHTISKGNEGKVGVGTDSPEAR